MQVLQTVPTMQDISSSVGAVVLILDGRESRVLVRDTWNTDIVSELTPESTDVVVYKHRFSGFLESVLDAVLKRFGAKHLMVAGCTPSICVDPVRSSGHLMFCPAINRNK